MILKKAGFLTLSNKKNVDKKIAKKMKKTTHPDLKH